MNDGLLIKFLLEETSIEETQLVKDWIAQNAANKQKFEQVELIWQTSKQLAHTHPLNEEEAWERFKERRSNLPVTHRLKPTTNWIKIAASVVVILGITIGLYVTTIGPKHPYFHTIEWSSAHVPMTDTLPDGTIVTLNKHSKIAYRENPFTGKRQVSMEGEAFFMVHRNPSQSFEVRIKDVQVHVLGTSFNVKSDEDKTEVIVETGAVQVRRNDVIIQLKPDERAIAHVEEKGLEQQAQTDHLYDYYRTKVFKLNHTPLWRFVDLLSKVYGTNIVIENNDIVNLPITTTFANESLTVILQTLSESLQVKIEKKGRTIIIKK